MMHRTILVGATPDEPGHDALMLGIELARPLGAEVVLAAVRPVAAGPEVLESAHQALEELRAGAPTDVPVSVRAVNALTVLGGLDDLAAELDAQLIVLGPSNRGLLGRAVYGDLAADTLWTHPCAIAVAAPGQAARCPQVIGVAWNATPEADEALEWAVQLAERTAGTVRVIHVLDGMRVGDGRPHPEMEMRLEALRTEAQQRARTETVLTWGDPAATLAEMSRDVDLLVLGSRGRGELARRVLGSVSTRLLHSAACPVVVLPRGVHAPLDTAAV